MIKFLKNLLLKEEVKEKEIEPCKLFEKEILHNMEVIYRFTDGDCIKIMSNKKDVICPLDGLLIDDKDTGYLIIDHGHFYIDNEMRRVMTEYHNVENIINKKQNTINTLIGCKFVFAGDILGNIKENELLEFRLLIDHKEVDPEPFFDVSYK